MSTRLKILNFSVPGTQGAFIFFSNLSLVLLVLANYREFLRWDNFLE